ncbi:MAG: TonB family protein [Bryobacteraceae bacterium]
MNYQLMWNNLVLYSLQIGLLVGVAALVPAALRLRVPRARLAYWHILLAACLLLPQVRPWRREVVAADVQISTHILSEQPGTPAPRSLPWSQIALLLLAAGMAGRLAWLGTGFWKLRQYRRRAQSAPQPAIATPWETRALVLLSDEVSGPVTFGWRRPVVLLPARFPEFGPRVQQAILCHELLHVARRDWLFAIAEEVIRAVFWFHPAIWWLLGEIQLAREQAVDREAIRHTEARDEYVDALLAIAGAERQGAMGCDLAPAPLFLRKRHLKHRVVSLFKEVGMSKTRLISALAGCLLTLAAACWLVTGALPLAAAPQVAADASGVTVDTGGAELLHRPPVAYPEEARKKGVGGTVAVQVALDGNGNVTDAHAISGPAELRKAALQSVLDWHFAHDSAGSTRQVAITFQAAEAALVPAAPKTAPSAGASSDKSWQGNLKSIGVLGLSDAARADLLARLPVHQGDTLTNDSLIKLQEAVRAFDEHLTFAIGMDGDNANVQITAPGFRIKVGGNVQQHMLVSQPHPIYPAEAKAARIQGVVRLKALIGMDGTVKNLEVMEGDPTLAAAALTAVKQWVYKPTLLNGDPVEVQTVIDVNFTLSQ